MNAMRSSRALPILAVFALASLDAHAQTLPWPTDPPRAGAPAATPAPMAAPPAQMAPAMMPGPMQAPPMQAGPPGGAPPCIQQFTKLRAETEKRANEAKAGRDRRVPREEMCKLIQVYANAEAKWVKYTEDNTTTCGIPPQVATQLKTVHARTLVIRKQICAAGPAAAGPPPAPSLSDALGTTTLPIPETTNKTGPGTFDTLTGNAITR